MGSELSDEARAVVRMWERLPDDDRYAVMEHLSDRLLEPTGREDARSVVSERREAIRVMGLVAEHVKVESAGALTVKMFDAAPASIRSGWKSGRVIRAWGRWRAAQDALSLSGAASALVEREVRVGVRANPRKREDPLIGLREWLSTRPRVMNQPAYHRWAKRRNAARGADQLTVIESAPAIASRLGIVWNDCIRVARGDIRLADAQPLAGIARERLNRTPYDLIALSEVAAILGKSESGAGNTAARPDFPKAAVVRPRTRLWFRADVEAYAHGEPFPEREAGALDAVFLDAGQLAERYEISRARILNGREGLPAPAIKVGSLNLWLRAEVEAAESSNAATSGLPPI